MDHNKLWKILKEMGIPDQLTCLLRNLYAGQEATVRTGHRTTFHISRLILYHWTTREVLTIFLLFLHIGRIKRDPRISLNVVFIVLCHVPLVNRMILDGPWIHLKTS